MKIQFFFVYFFVFLLILPLSIAYEISPPNHTTHQKITKDALKIWSLIDPEVIRHGNKSIDSPLDIIGLAIFDHDDDIIIGSGEEDKAFGAAVHINFNHFWQPDDPDDGDYDNGLGPSGSSYRRALNIWDTKVIPKYLKGDIDESYYWLGRVAHLLEDASQPSHVHNDPHPPNTPFSSVLEDYTGNMAIYSQYQGERYEGQQYEYENLIDGFNWAEVDASGTVDKKYIDFFRLFWYTAQKTQYWASDDENANYVWVNLSGSTKNWDCSGFGSMNLWYNDGYYLCSNFINDSSNLNGITVQQEANATIPHAMKAVAGLYRLFEDSVHIDWPFFLHDLKRSGVSKLRGDLNNEPGTVFSVNFGATTSNELDKIGIADVNSDGKQDLILTSGLSSNLGVVYRVTFNRTSSGAQLNYQTPPILLKTYSAGFVGSPSLADIKTTSDFSGKEIIYSTSDNIVRAIGKNGLTAWTFDPSSPAGHPVEVGHTAVVDIHTTTGNEVIFATDDAPGGSSGAYLFILNGNNGAVIEQLNIGSLGTIAPVSIADIKGDSHYEIIVPTLDEVRVFSWTGSNYALDYSFGEPGVINGVLISDIYGEDKDYKLVYATADDYRCPSGYSCQDKIFVRNTNTYQINQSITTTDYVFVQPIAVNLDSDKQLELITVEKDSNFITSEPDGKIKRYDFTPGSNYAVTNQYPSNDVFGLSFTTPVAANINGVGNYEIIYGKSGGQVIIFSSTLSTSGYPTYSLGGVIASAPAVGDWDNDGYAEIAVKRQTSSLDSDPPELVDPLMYPMNETLPTRDSTTTGFLTYITNVNFQPFLEPLNDQTGYVNKLYIINTTTLDPNNDTLTIDYSYPFNSSGQFLPNASQTGTYEVFVTVSDGNLTDTQEFMLNVFADDTMFENNLSNGLSTYQMNLTADVSQTVFLKIPKDANIQHAEITIEGLAS